MLFSQAFTEIWGVIFVLLGVVQGNDQCKTIQYLPCIKNKTLIGHVINSYKVFPPGFEECQIYCYVDSNCFSYNLGPVTGQLRTCELNDFDHVTFPNDLKDRVGTEYCPIKSPCSAQPCKHGQVCSPNYFLGTATCQDGLWTKWGPWSPPCLFPRVRTRLCLNPYTNETATDCPGKSQDIKVARHCDEVLQYGCHLSGVYTINPDGRANNFTVYCDQETAGGGWTVIQRRKDGSVDFYRGWQDYKNGFGNLTGEFWLGLDKIHQLTNPTRNRLRVDIEDVSAEYDYFAVEDEANQYRLKLGSYAGGQAGDSLSYHANYSFTTIDRDHDINQDYNCAVKFKGAWWHKNCHKSNLNGQYIRQNSHEYGIGINWNTWKGQKHSALTADMKLRPA